MSVVAVTLAATLFIQLGYFLWKLSADRRPASIGAPTAWATCRATVADARWLGGLAATGVGWVLFVQATALGDISLVQPLMSAGDLVLVLLAVAFLGERLGRAEWAGVATIVGGAVLLAAGAGTPRAATLAAGPLMQLLLVAAIAGAVLLAWARRGPDVESPLAGVVGLAFGCGAVLTKALTAGHAELGAGLLTDPILYGVVAANAVGLVLLQIAFRRGRAAVVVPLQLAVASLLTVAGGVWVFGEQVSALRVAGVLLVIAGTAMLHRGRPSTGSAAPAPHGAAPTTLALDTECR